MLGLPAKEAWKPWKVNVQLAGSWNRFDLQSQASLGFETLRGNGRKVPTFRPMEAFEVFRPFQNSQEITVAMYS